MKQAEAKRTLSRQPRQGYESPLMSEQLVQDLLCAREGLNDEEADSPAADSLDKAIEAAMVPNGLTPQLVQRLHIVISMPCGDEDVDGARALLQKLTPQTEPGFTWASQAALIVTLERTIESGSLPEKLLRELTKEFGLEATQNLVLERISTFEERAEAVGKQRDEGLVLFSDEFAKETGNWPRPADYFGA